MSELFNTLNYPGLFGASGSFYDLERLKLLKLMEMLNRAEQDFRLLPAPQFTLPKMDFSYLGYVQSMRLPLFDINPYKSTATVPTSTSTSEHSTDVTGTAVSEVEDPYKNFTGNGAKARLKNGEGATDKEYTMLAPTYVGAQNDNIVAAAVNAGNNLILTVNNVKSIQEDFRNGKYDKEGDKKNEARWRAGAAMGATTVGAGLTAAASFLDPGAQNAHDVKTEGMINAGLDTVSLFGVYGQLAAGVGRASMALGNAYAKKVGENVSVDTELMTLQGNAYEQTFADVNKAANPGLKAIFHRGRVKDLLQQAIYKQQLISNINDKAQDQFAAAGYEGIGLNNQMTTNGDYLSLRAGKQGMKMEHINKLFENQNSTSWAKEVVKASKGLRLPTFRAVEADIDLSLDNDPEKEVPAVLQLQSITALNILENDIKTLKTLIHEGSVDKVTLGSHTLFTFDDDDMYNYVVNNPDLMNYLKTKYPNVTVSKNESDPVEVDITPKDEETSLNSDSKIINNPLENFDLSTLMQNDLFLLDLNLLTSAINSNDVLANANIFKTIGGAMLPYVTRGVAGYNFDGINFVKDLNTSEEPFAKLLNQYITNEAATKDVDTSQIAVNLFNVLNNFDIQQGQVNSFKLGGTFNVIPDGALHKCKHNMEDAEGLTKKGIPVITEEDGKKVQQAEIEVNEIIFRLEVTEKLEKLAKEGTEEAAIEAGKLLTKEILHNTLDNTGLIKEIL